MQTESAEGSAQNGPLPRAEAEAQRLTMAAREQGITAALVGGIAVYLRCQSASRPPLQRDYKDIDLVTTKTMSRRLTQLLTSHGHEPDKRFNALHGGQRLFFWDEQHGRQLDVFIDDFEMCHRFDLTRRLAIDPTAPTLPLADLVLTKMQVVEMNLKDMKDLAALLQDQPLTQNEEGINLEYITQLTHNDWGLQHTLEGTITKVRQADPAEVTAEAARYPLRDQLDALDRAMQDAPKSRGWKLRSKVGERVRWYELPEEARA
ncbi:MAG: hypothetical protein ACR2JC_03395 [Chloroflexota bacterium]